jgi:hypothetical protein
MRWPTWFVILFMRNLFRFNKSMKRYTAHAASAGSMREARFNYDAMLATAADLSVPTPRLRELGAYLRATTDPGRTG